MKRKGWLLLGCAMAVSFAVTQGVSAADSVELLPARFILAGPEARQTLVVERVRGATYRGQLTQGIVLESSDAQIVRIEDGRAIPVGNGTATISVSLEDQVATAEVVVVDQDIPHVWSFRNHVQSVLSKVGCNSGACHGAAAGKNGFKLSLRGYDPQFDFRSITRQSRGRRIVPSDPGRSLFLTKPTGAVPHKGGVRLELGSREFRALAEWLASGHRPPEPGDPRLERLEILPGNAVLSPEQTQQFIVQAHFTNGHTEDVTRWARYTSTNLSVAEVDNFGAVKVTGSGEGAVVAWYLAKNSIASVTVPHEPVVARDVFTLAERSNFIDDLVLDKLDSLNLPPSAKSSDGEFLRRVYLDTIGVLPPVAKVRVFLADTSPDKRAKVVDFLLARPEFVDYWAYRWSDLLLVSSASLPPQAVDAYYKWVRKQVEENTPWDQFARDVVTARGSSLENGEANFYALHQDPLGMAETVSMAFLGMSINCARCHDHPLEKWTNDDYYGMANLFARVRGKGWSIGNGDGARTVFVTSEGELIQPRTGRPQPPRPLDGEPVSFESTGDRREHVARWLTSTENPYFTRAIVNRVWANFLGVGIVESVDDLRLTNPPSNAALMDALASYLAESGYDLKRLMRVILTSQTYQRSSQALPGNAADQRNYASYYPRRLKAEVLLDAVSRVTGAPTEFKDYPKGTRALQLRDTSIASYFLQTFGRPERVLTCECERSDEPSMVQVLHIVNGDTLNGKLRTKGNEIDRLLADKTPDADVIDQLYLAALSRFPMPDEQQELLMVLQETAAQQESFLAQIKAAYQENLSRKPTGEEQAKIDELAEREKRRTLEDLYWSVLSSKEFLFQH
jgi:hypothetical protein